MSTPTFSDRIQFLIDAAPSQKAFARLAHISDATLINWLRAHHPHAAKLRRVAASLGVALEWLRDGQGEDYQQRMAFREKLGCEPVVPGELLRQARLKEGISQKTLAYRLGSGVKYVEFLERGLLPRPSKACVTSLCHALPELQRNELLAAWGYPPMDEEGHEFTWGHWPDGSKGVFVPLISPSEIEARVVHGSHLFRDHVLIFLFELKLYRAFALRVTGPSMEPVLSDRDVVVCAPERKVRDGDAAVVCTRSAQLFVKYWRRRGGRVLLESAHPQHPPLEFWRDEIAAAWPIVQTVRLGKMRQPHQAQPPPEGPRKARTDTKRKGTTK